MFQTNTFPCYGISYLFSNVVLFLRLSSNAQSYLSLSLMHSYFQQALEFFISIYHLHFEYLIKLDIIKANQDFLLSISFFILLIFLLFFQVYLMCMLNFMKLHLFTYLNSPNFKLISFLKNLILQLIMQHLDCRSLIFIFLKLFE